MPKVTQLASQRQNKALNPREPGALLGLPHREKGHHRFVHRGSQTEVSEKRLQFLPETDRGLQRLAIST